MCVSSKTKQVMIF